MRPATGSESRLPQRLLNGLCSCRAPSLSLPRNTEIVQDAIDFTRAPPNCIVECRGQRDILPADGHGNVERKLTFRFSDRLQIESGSWLARSKASDWPPGDCEIDVTTTHGVHGIGRGMRFGVV